MSQSPDNMNDPRKQRIASLFSQVPESFKSSELPERKFIYEDLDLAPTAGYPSVRYLCPELQMDMRICPSPLVGVHDTYIDYLFYPVAVITPHNFSNREVTKAIAGLLETFSMSALERVLSQDGAKIPSAGAPQGQSFIILITKEPDQVSGYYCYNAMAALDVGGDTVGHHMKSLERQLKDMHDIYRSTESHLNPDSSSDNPSF